MKYFCALSLLATAMIINASDDIPWFDYRNDNDATINHEQIPAEIYKEIVKHCPIVCVDIFVYDTTTQSYLLVLRNTPPAKGIYWYPGGRLLKGESCFQAAQRKCSTEAGIAVEPVAVIGTYQTLFPDSAWGCTTHTVNIAVFAKVKQGEQPNLDKYHETFLWQPLAIVPTDPYCKQIYDDVLPLVKGQ